MSSPKLHSDPLHVPLSLMNLTEGYIIVYKSVLLFDITSLKKVVFISTLTAA